MYIYQDLNDSGGRRVFQDALDAPVDAHHVVDVDVPWRWIFLFWCGRRPS